MSGQLLVRHLQAEGFILVEMKGEFDAPALSEATGQMVELIRETGCSQILMDHRQATPRLSVLEQYERPERAASLGVPKSARIALVHNGSREVYDFIETVAVNRGFVLKTFERVVPAKDWLKNGPGLSEPPS